MVLGRVGAPKMEEIPEKRGSKPPRKKGSKLEDEKNPKNRGQEAIPIIEGRVPGTFGPAGGVGGVQPKNQMLRI